METEDKKRKNSVGSKLKKMGQQVKHKAGSTAAAASPYHHSSTKKKYKSQSDVDHTEIDECIKW